MKDPFPFPRVMDTHYASLVAASYFPHATNKGLRLTLSPSFLLRLARSYFLPVELETFPPPSQSCDYVIGRFEQSILTTSYQFSLRNYRGHFNSFLPLLDMGEVFLFPPLGVTSEFSPSSLVAGTFISLCMHPPTIPSGGG